jgi:hypothetical protein
MGMVEAAEDAEMRQAFNAAFADLGITYVESAAGTSIHDDDDGAVGVGGASDGGSFAAKLAAAIDVEVQLRREERRAHIDQYLAPPPAALHRSVCATAPPVSLAATPPRATAMV